MSQEPMFWTGLTPDRWYDPELPLIVDSVEFMQRQHDLMFGEADLDEQPAFEQTWDEFEKMGFDMATPH